jgi:tRNA 2-thiouridine synthesizing protein B
MLHIVNKSPMQSPNLGSCLRLAQDGHAVLLIEDGIYAATTTMAERSGLAAATGRLKVYALTPDVEARAMAGRMAAGVTLVDYAGFVDLVAEHPNNQSWL